MWRSRILQTIAACGVWVLAPTSLFAQNREQLKAESAAPLPVFVIQTKGQTVQDRTRSPVSVTVLVPTAAQSGAFVSADGSGNAELSVRGNSSYHFSKKSYRLELQDDNGNDRKAALSGLPADSDWVLYASVTDNTFARNLLAHELWRATGRYAVRWRFVEVFVVMNSESKELEVNRPHPGSETFNLSPRLRPQPQETEDGATTRGIEELKDVKLDRPHPIPLPQERGNGSWASVDVKGSVLNGS